MKMTLQEKRTLTPEEKLVRKKELRNQYYREYYNNHKENFKEYQQTYKKNINYVENTKTQRKKYYENNPEYRAKNNMGFYKKKYVDDEDFKIILNKDNITNVEKLLKIKEFHFKKKFNIQ